MVHFQLEVKLIWRWVTDLSHAQLSYSVFIQVRLILFHLFLKQIVILFIFLIFPQARDCLISS